MDDHRPPRLTDKPVDGLTGGIDTNPAARFSADLESAILALVRDPRTVHHHVFVASHREPRAMRMFLAGASAQRSGVLGVPAWGAWGARRCHIGGCRLVLWV